MAVSSTAAIAVPIHWVARRTLMRRPPLVDYCHPLSGACKGCKGTRVASIRASCLSDLRIDLPRWQPALVVTAIAVALGLVAADGLRLHAQSRGEPFAALLPAVPLDFPNDTDSNSPAVWEILDGTWTLSLFNSVAGWAAVSRGTSLKKLADQGAIRFEGAAPLGGMWFESMVRDADAWYGFYHNEREHIVCEGSGKVWPRIGLARSEDRGATWQDLGPVIETPAWSVTCDTSNHYFVGGVGDFSVALDADRNYAYLYYTQYVEAADAVGVSVARLAWADRDQPAGRADIWSDGVWLPPAASADPGEEANEQVIDPAASPWDFPLATPFLRAVNRWDDERAGVDVFWGPSIHWNASLETYVMLLNQATSNTWEQGGVYVSFNDRLDAPTEWSAPALVTRGGSWYPQVIGLDPAGTDAYSGAVARFFMAGKSEHLIIFGRR